jgi:DNA-binding transcriptional LysR family regulator
MNLLVSLRYLVALDDHHHFGRAALSCNVTQPALSNALRALEDHYGLAIIKRGRNFAGFTPEGLQVLTSARRVLHDQELLKQELQSTSSQPKGHILIGAVPTAIPLAARFAARLQSIHPHIRLTVRSMSSIEIETGLEQLALDIGLGYTERIEKGSAKLSVVAQYEERYYLLQRSIKNLTSDRLIIGEPISWSDAAKLPLCLLSTEMHNRALMDRMFALVGQPVIPVIETNSIMTLILTVVAGSVCSIMPGSLVSLSDGFAQIEARPLVNPDIDIPISFITPRTDRTSRVVLAAIEFAQSQDWLDEVKRHTGNLNNTK